LSQDGGAKAKNAEMMSDAGMEQQYVHSMGVGLTKSDELFFQPTPGD
jgi:hypothetical protein